MSSAKAIHDDVMLKIWNGIKSITVHTANFLLTPAGLFSPRYNQLYTSLSGASAQARAVFIEGNHLEERWKQAKPHTQFTIGELGFGVGLNWMTTLECWKKNRPENAWLHYIAIEQSPIHPQELGKDFLPYQEFPELTQQLASLFPPKTHGLHEIIFPDYHSTLTCIWMDVDSALKEIKTPVDSWFLDGFSPKENPDMWSEKIAQQLAKYSHTNTTLATYSVASMVRKNLTAAGFRVEKKQGLPPKKERLEGRLQEVSSRPSPEALAKGETGATESR